MEFLDARCPSCGGQLKVPEDKATFICGYCGANILVRDAVTKGGIDIENLLKLAKMYQEQSNYEKAEENYEKILEVDANNYDAWQGKLEARCFSWEFGAWYGSERYNSILSIFRTCEGLDPEGKRGSDRFKAMSAFWLCLPKHVYQKDELFKVVDELEKKYKKVQ